MNPKCSSETRAGFTRLELCVVIATLAMLAVLILPVRGNGRAPESLVCLDNLRRLSAAWLLYADDNDGRFPGNYHGSFAAVPSPSAPERPWATGWLDWTTTFGNTNTTYLTESRYASLAPYLGRDASVFKCPSDVYVSKAQLGYGWSSRVRTYSMNCHLGEGNQTTGPVEPFFVAYTTRQSLEQMKPGELFVFLEEHPDSLNDPLFFTPRASSSAWVDFPGSFHGGAGSFAFADGHAELHRWQTAATVRPVNYRGDTVNVPYKLSDPDPEWLLKHAR